MTKHKRIKALRRRKQNHKEMNLQQHSWRRKFPESEKTLSEDEILAERKPIAEEGVGRGEL